MAKSAYSREQVGQFLSHIELPASQHHAQPTLALLQALHVHMISTVPYDNLSLHYNPVHAISIDPQHVFRKIVASGRGRGGYCMEIAVLYNHMLVALGYDAYLAGVRTRPRVHGVPEGDFPGWIHVVSLVTLADGSKYHVDVGFGGDGPTAPLPLVEGQVHANLGTQEVRLVRDWIPTQTQRTEASRLWVYQYRNNNGNNNGNGSDASWISFYAFPELPEFLQPDLEMMNWWACHNPGFHQRRTALLIKFLRRPVVGEGNPTATGTEDQTQEIYGKRMLVNGVVKENLGGRTRVVVECRTEDERIEALQRYFGITLTEEERLGIRGWATELGRGDD